MPRLFGSRPSSIGLGQSIGWRPRSAAGRVAGDAGYLAHGARTSSHSEPSSWRFRFVASCALVIAEYLFLYFVLAGRDNLVALGSSWLVLLLLPRPTPRIPLVAGRCLAFVTTIANAAVGLNWLAAAWPPFEAWTGVLWFVLVGCLLVWAFMVPRPRAPRGTETSADGFAEARGEGARGWSNVPRLKFDDVGGASRRVRDIEMDVRLEGGQIVRYLSR